MSLWRVELLIALNLVGVFIDSASTDIIEAGIAGRDETLLASSYASLKPLLLLLNNNSDDLSTGYGEPLPSMSIMDRF